MANSLVTNVDEKTQTGIFCRKTFTQTSGDVLLLVMGYGGSLRIWPPSFVESLAHKYVVVSYDNRGTGLSIVPQDPTEYTIKNMSDDLDEVTKQFHLSKFHLLGYSMGGCIALQYAHDHSDKVKSLFLLASTAGGALYVKPAQELSTQLANPQGETLWDLYMSTFKLMYSPQTLIRCHPTLKAMFENSKDLLTSPIALQGHSHAFRNFDGTSYLSELHMPTTILAGEADRMMPVQNSKNLAKTIPGAKIILLPDCEHAAHVQEEATVVREIEKACR
jgi:pimeloyl-ACP methyl ester carboxylesterase